MISWNGSRVLGVLATSRSIGMYIHAHVFIYLGIIILGWTTLRTCKIVARYRLNSPSFQPVPKSKFSPSLHRFLAPPLIGLYIYIYTQFKHYDYAHSESLAS